MSEQQIRIAADRCRDFTGYLSLPVFRELCRITPEDIGLPDPGKAYREASMSAQGHQWSHPAVYFAACETGWYEIRSKAEKEIFPLFRHNYDKIISRVMAGERLDVPVQKALPEKVPMYLSEDEVKGKLDNLKNMFN